MQPRDPAFEARVREIFYAANYIQALGIELVSVTPGRCETRLVVADRHLQQNGFVHAGVLATLADHSAGGAGGTLIAPDQVILTAEFKINFMRPARGSELTCTGTVLKPGRALTFAEAEVFAHADGRATLVAKALVTLAMTQA